MHVWAPGMPNVNHSIVILNRLVSWTEAGIELEADPRHVDLLLKEIGCEGAKVTTPLIKERLEEVQDAEALDSDLAAKYCSVSMRLSYLAQDRRTEESYHRSLEDAQAWCKVSSILSEDDSPVSESKAISRDWRFGSMPTTQVALGVGNLRQDLLYNLEGARSRRRVKPMV